MNVSSTYIYYNFLVRKIQRRLVDILISLPHRPRNPKVPNPLPFRRESIEELMQKSMHVPFFQGDRIACARCYDKLPLKGECTRSWLKGICHKLHKEGDRPVPLVHHTVQLAHQTSHPSHTLYIFRGFIFCYKCGHYGKTRFVNLAKACEPPLSQHTHGARAMKVLKEGRRPPGELVWPDAQSPFAHTHSVQEQEALHLLLLDVEQLQAELPLQSADPDTDLEDNMSACSSEELSAGSSRAVEASAAKRRRLHSQSSSSSSD